MIDWMIKHKFAKNVFNAVSMAKLLDMYGSPFSWAGVKKVILYRRWRNAGEKPATAAEKAKSNTIIKGMF